LNFQSMNYLPDYEAITHYRNLRRKEDGAYQLNWAEIRDGLPIADR